MSQSIKPDGPAGTRARRGRPSAAKKLPAPAAPSRERAKLARAVLAAFQKLYPDADCGLGPRDPFGLLVATILSAQCSDARVNQVAPVLLKAYPHPAAMAAATEEDIAAIIRSCGFFRTKAKNIRGASARLVSSFGGETPRSMEDLLTLPGVGRKTANCVRGNAFRLPALTVDTHLGRISRRLGLTRHEDPDKVEADLGELIPEERWTLFSHQGIAHGRALCKSQKPRCDRCPLAAFCPYPSASA
ncbi:MAG: endonuclease III [Deltaproteobacteria bacterium]|jgi:endonuclease-3|nr:endonuclease III [Deltaproteobacteria bacterium]